MKKTDLKVVVQECIKEILMEMDDETKKLNIERFNVFNDYYKVVKIIDYLTYRKLFNNEVDKYFKVYDPETFIGSCKRYISYVLN